MMRHVAYDAAHAMYASLMGANNELYAEWKRQNPDCGDKELERRFVARNWVKCLPFARATLAQLLTKSIDDAQKEAIMEALVLDRSLMLGRPDNKATVHEFLGLAPGQEAQK